MAPPPVTPSPHRFITNPKPRTASKPPPSSLRVQLRASEPSSQQFAPTPRFAIPSARWDKEEDVVPEAATSPLVSRVRRPPRPRKVREDIEDDSDSDDGGNVAARHNDDDDDAEILPSNNTASQHADPNVSNNIPLNASTPHPRKRPRPPPDPHNDPIILSSSPPLPQSPLLPISPPSPIHHHPHSHPHPRFLFTHPNPISPHQPPLPTRPTFILPPAPYITNPVPAPIPIPQLLSPHRRGQKFLPAGLAATARDWVVETSRHTVANNDEEPAQWVEKIRVGGVRRGMGVGMWLVRGEGEERGTREREGGREGEGEGEGEGSGDGDGEGEGEGEGEGKGKGKGKGWVLMRDGNGGGREEVRTGAVVGVKRPVWDVKVQGVVWRVGVEWRVL